MLGKTGNPSGNPNWRKGVSGNPKGKTKGSTHILTNEVKCGILKVYKNLGSWRGVLKWAKDNQGDFYREVFRMMPKEAIIEGDMNVKFEWINENEDDKNPVQTPPVSK